MSLLFDALKRAQGNNAQTVQMPGASSHLPSANTEASPQTDGAQTARTIIAAGNNPGSHIMLYAAAGLVLLTGGVVWFLYLQNQYIPIATPRPVPHIAAASQPIAASSVAATIAALPATASGGETTAAGKDWTRPVESGKPPRPQRKPAHSGIQASTGPDPLREAYRALAEGQLERAEQGYLAVLAQRPHEKDALLGLAVIAQRKQQTERAGDYYRQVLREDIGNASAAAGLVSLSMQADPLSAESQIRELLDLRPTAPEFHYALGGVLARQQRWGEAQQAFFRAYNLTPDNALYAYNLAVSLDRLHQPSAARSYYEKARQLARPEDPTLDPVAITRRIQELKNSP